MYPNCTEVRRGGVGWGHSLIHKTLDHGQVSNTITAGTGARPTSGLGGTREANPRKKFFVEIWKLALKAFSSCMLADELWGQMSTVPWKGDTVMVEGESAKGRLLLRAPSM